MIASASNEFEALIGHDEAQALFLDALTSERLHHAWLLTGPKGIGKASLAKRLTAILLSNSEDGLIDKMHPSIRLLETGAHPDFRMVARAVDAKTGKLKSDISVAEVRKLHEFLSTTAAQGGWRIILIDAVDDLNRNAANALLKILEEPPKKVVFFLISHAPGRLLPTIRSRCRQLRLNALSDAQVDMVLSQHMPELDAEDARELSLLAQGSPGLALELAGAGGAEILKTVNAIFSNAPHIDMNDVHKLGDMVSKRRKDDGFAIFSQILIQLLERAVKSDARGQRELSLPTEALLSFHQDVLNELSRAQGLNLEPRYVILSLFSRLAQLMKS